MDNIRNVFSLKFFKHSVPRHPSNGPCLLFSTAFHRPNNNRGSPCTRYEDTRGMDVHFNLFLTSARDCVSGKISHPRPRCDWEEASRAPHRQSGQLGKLKVPYPPWEMNNAFQLSTPSPSH